MSYREKQAFKYYRDGDVCTSIRGYTWRGPVKLWASGDRGSPGLPAGADLGQDNVHSAGRRGDIRLEGELFPLGHHGLQLLVKDLLGDCAQVVHELIETFDLHRYIFDWRVGDPDPWVAHVGWPLVERDLPNHVIVQPAPARAQQFFSDTG